MDLKLTPFAKPTVSLWKKFYFLRKIQNQKFGLNLILNEKFSFYCFTYLKIFVLN